MSLPLCARAPKPRAGARWQSKLRSCGYSKISSCSGAADRRQLATRALITFGYACGAPVFFPHVSRCFEIEHFKGGPRATTTFCKFPECAGAAVKSQLATRALNMFGYAYDATLFLPHASWRSEIEHFKGGPRATTTFCKFPESAGAAVKSQLATRALNMFGYA